MNDHEFGFNLLMKLVFEINYLQALSERLIFSASREAKCYFSQNSEIKLNDLNTFHLIFCKSQHTITTPTRRHCSVLSNILDNTSHSQLLCITCIVKYTAILFLCFFLRRNTFSYELICSRKI